MNATIVEIAIVPHATRPLKRFAVRLVLQIAADEPVDYGTGQRGKYDQT
jgi:hypothetical protein